MATVFTEYTEELEGELALRNIDIRDCDDPDSSFTLRRLFVIYKALPPRNAVSVKVAKLSPQAQIWDVNSYILANVFDAIESLNYSFRCANRGKNSPEPKKPKPHPRPDEAKPRKQTKFARSFPGETVYAP